MNLLRTELDTAEIPELYLRFANVIDDKHWKNRVSLLKSAIRGNRFLKDYLHAENSIAFALDRCRDIVAKNGDIAQAETDNQELYPTIGFVVQVLSMMDISSRVEAERIRRRVHGALNNPDDMRALRLELIAATHFARRGHKIVWPEMCGLGTFDLLVESLGSAGLEIECKSISDDKGRKVHRHEVLEFYNLLWPHLAQTRKTLNVGLSVVLTVPGRLPTQHKDRVALAKNISRQILNGQSAKLDDGSYIRVSEFDASDLSHLVSNKRPRMARDAIDNLTKTQNREAMIIGTEAGGALMLTVQSAAPDTLLDSVFDILSSAAKKQVTGTRPAILFVGFHGLHAEQLLSIAHQDNDSTQQPTALHPGINKFLSGPNRDHVVGVGFLSRSALLPVSHSSLDSGGSAYFFPKRESSHWHDDFSGLFS